MQEDAADIEPSAIKPVVRVSLPTTIELVDAPEEVLEDESALKEWILEHHRETLLAALTVEHSGSKSTTAFKTREQKQFHSNSLSSRAHVDQPAESSVNCAKAGPLTSIPSFNNSRRRDLLDCIASVQRQFFQSEQPKVVFGLLLEALLELTDSEYGFIGEIKYENGDRNDPGSTMYLQTHAITNIAWNQATRQFYEDNKVAGLKFYNLNTLFGTVMTTGEPLIANDPSTHPKRAGVPEGHPPLRHFLGIPFFKEGGEMNGMVGISNKPGGYSREDIDFLEPITVTCSNLIQAYLQKNQNEWLINNLEASVRARTQELELANASLEEANRRVRQTAQMQLQHFGTCRLFEERMWISEIKFCFRLEICECSPCRCFLHVPKRSFAACMSHEIRTPLNCIIGMSSFLKETEMTRLQEDTMQMIIESGDLLVAIINDVLDYSKLETGAFELEIRKGDLEQTLSSIVLSIESRAKSRGQSVRQHYSASVPRYVHMDSRRIQQILYNLLGNAIKFSNDNAVVEFFVDYLPSSLKVSGTGPSVDLNRNLLNKSEAPVPLPAAAPVGHETKAITITSTSDCDSSSNSFESCSCPPPCKEAEHLTSSTQQIKESTSRCPFQRSHSAATESVASTDGSDNRLIEHYSPTKRSCDPATCTDPRSCSAPRILRFVVRDYGRGIPKQDFKKIFMPFQQVTDSKSEDVHGGTGLGLAITHRLVSAMGGVISVDSEFGAWSEFTVDVPFCDPPTDVAAIKEKMRDCTVIVVGVEGPERESVRKVFQSFEVDFVIFDAMQEMKTAFLENNAVDKDKTYICLFQEDAYHGDTEPFQLLSKLARTTLMMFGREFRSNTENQVRCLEKIIPSVLMEKLIETKLEISEARAEDSTSGIPFERIRVLVAEDNKINQKVLQRMLVRLGIKNVDIVENGKLAVEKEAANEYDIVLMDQQMPVMGGMAACRHICSRTGGHPKPIVVFVTAHVSPDFEAQAYEAGCTDFIPKPFKLDQIEAMFENHFAVL